MIEQWRKIIGILTLHIIGLYFLQLLWKDKNEAIRRGAVVTKMRFVSRRKSPRLFFSSVWVDFTILAVMYLILLVCSVFSLWR